jgi:hypothetical protein
MSPRSARKAAGLDIPNGRGFGIRGTSEVRKISGEPHMVHDGGITEEDIAESYVLACCSRPLGGIEVAV